MTSSPSRHRNSTRMSCGRPKAVRALILYPMNALVEDQLVRLRKALDSFATLDAVAARRVLEGDDEIDRGEEVVVREAIEQISHDPEICSQEVEFILIAKNLERVADYATNIAEEVVLVSEARNLKHAQKLQG